MTPLLAGKQPKPPLKSLYDGVVLGSTKSQHPHYVTEGGVVEAVGAFRAAMLLTVHQMSEDEHGRSLLRLCWHLCSSATRDSPEVRALEHFFRRPFAEQ